MRALLITLLVGAGIAASASAQSSLRRGGGPDTIPVEDAAAFSKQIERRLAQDGARLALVFRSGQRLDELPEGVRFTHGAFWVLQDIIAPNGDVIQGYAVYNLYAGGDTDVAPGRSALVQDFPYDFTAPMAEARAGVIIPSPEMQRRIVGIMASPTYAQLHNPSFSIVANPHDLRHQNCNEFYLDVIAAAAWEETDRAQIKANLAAYFEPAVIQTTWFQRTFGPMFNPRVQTDDHDSTVETTTFLSMAAFMQEYGLSSDVYELTYDAEAGMAGAGLASAPPSG